MNIAKKYFLNESYTMSLSCERNKQSGFITELKGVLKHNGNFVKSFDKNGRGYYLLDGITKQKEVMFYGDLAIAECYKPDYDNAAEFMFYINNGTMIFDKNLNYVYYNKDGENITDKDAVLRLYSVYGPCVLIYMDEQLMLDEKFVKQLKQTAKKRLKLLKEKGVKNSKLEEEKWLFKISASDIQEQAINKVEKQTLNF